MPQFNPCHNGVHHARQGVRASRQVGDHRPPIVPGARGPRRLRVQAPICGHCRPRWRPARLGARHQGSGALRRGLRPGGPRQPQRGLGKALLPRLTSSISLPCYTTGPSYSRILPFFTQPKWFALVARAEFYFNDVQNEALAEQLRELKRYYEEIDRPIDFFFVCEPAWLDKFPQAKAVKRPAVALISTDQTWIT